MAHVRSLRNRDVGLMHRYYSVIVLDGQPVLSSTNYGSLREAITDSNALDTYYRNHK